MIALAAAGAAGVGLGLSLSWWEATLAGLPAVAAAAREAGTDLTLSGWQSLEVADALLVVLAAGTVALLAFRQAQLAAVAGLCAVAVVVSRLLSPPGGSDAVDLQLGGFVTLAGALALLAAGTLATRRP